MSQPISLTSAGTRNKLGAALEKTSELARRVTTRQSWFEFGWRWLAGAAAFFVLDLSFGLAVPFRWIGLIGLVAYPILTALKVREAKQAGGYPEERAARIVEEGHPELNNALINAVQFRRIVDGADPIQAELMRQEIARAEQVAVATPVEDVVDRQGERRARRILFAAAGAWLVVIVLFPNAVFTVLPRMFAPWLDNVTPPFSLTHLDLSPKGATVRYGGSLALEVSVQGPSPETLTLVSQSTKGNATELPMESTEPGKYALTLTNLKQDTWIVATGAGTRSGRYLVTVLLPPVAESVKATYTYAAYTRRASETEIVGDKGIHGWENTKVHLAVTANRALSSGELIIETTGADALRVALTPDPKDPRTVAGDFPITGNGKFRVALIGSDEQLNADAAHGTIVMEPDARPNVWFDSPGQSIAVTPDMSVTLAVGADGDEGITQVDLHRQINGIADNKNSLYQGEPQKRIGTRLSMDMSDLGVRPGDKITYFADAFDGAPKPNYAETDPFTIDVVSPEEYKKMLADQRSEEQLSREAKQIQEAIQSLADRQQELSDRMSKLAKALQAKPGDPELSRNMAEAQKQQAALQDEAKKLAQKLQDYAKSPSASPIESALKQQVSKAAQSIAQAASQMAGSQSSNPGSAADAAKKAASTLNKSAGETQKSVGQAMKSLDKISPLYEDTNRFMELLDRQGQLVLQARQFEQPGPVDAVDRSKLNELAAEQAKVQDELRALQDDFRRDAANAKADFPKAAASAVKIADEIGRRQIPPTMGTAHTAYDQQRGSDGFSNSKRAFDQMNAMVGMCQSGQGVCKGEADISLSRSLGKSSLGQSLGPGLNPGRGSKPGQGQGSSSGGQMSGAAGSMGEGSQTQMVAYTTDLKNLSSGGPSDGKYHRHAPGAEVAISPERIEKFGVDWKSPPKASDTAAKGYLPEYRKMIHDYFVSVGKEQKQ